MGDWDPNAGLFDDDEDNDEAQEDFTPGRELVVFLIDSATDMLLPMGDIQQTSTPSGGSFLEGVLGGVAEDLKARIIAAEADLIGVAFFNTREKKNIQESEGVFVLSELAPPSAHLIRDISTLSARFSQEIGSAPGVIPGSPENPLYNALWVAQAMFRSGPASRVSKRILILTNEDDPFGGADPLSRADMKRTTIQRAKDCQDLGIEVELVPLSRPGEAFNPRILYADMIQIDEDNDKSFMAAATQRFEDLKTRMKKRTYRKRMVRRVAFHLGGEAQIALRSYAMVRTARIAKDVYVDAKDNVPLKTESSLICQDTGAVLIATAVKRMQPYGSARVLFTPSELKEVKKITSVDLVLMGFKPLRCLRDYHNLTAPTFLYPDEQAVKGSTCATIAFHTTLLNQQKMAVACWGMTSAPRLVALIPQREELEEGFQVAPPGFQMLQLPFLEDIRKPEEYHPWSPIPAPRAADDQILAARNLIHRLNLKNFSMLDIQNPSLQSHYAMLQAMALEEDHVPQVKDDTLPDYAAMQGEVVQSAVRHFKDVVYGPDFDAKLKAMASEKDNKRKAKDEALAEKAAKVAKYDWNKEADEGRLTKRTIEELKDFLRTKGVPLGGNKQDLVNKVLVALKK